MMKWLPFSVGGTLVKAVLLWLCALALCWLYLQSKVHTDLDHDRTRLQLVATGNAAHEGPRDINGRPHDWITLKNVSEANSLLSDFFLADNPRIPERFRLPHFLLKPGEQATVFASGEERVDSIYRFEFRVPAKSKYWKERMMNCGNGKIHTLISQANGLADAEGRLPVEASLFCPLKRSAEARYILYLEVLVGPYTGTLSWQFAGQSGELVIPAASEFRLATIPVLHPERPFGSWIIGPTEQTLKIQSLDGFVSCRRMLLLRQGAPIGGGFQEVHLPFKLGSSDLADVENSDDSSKPDKRINEPVLLGTADQLVDFLPPDFSESRRSSERTPPTFSLPSSGVAESVALSVADPDLVVCYTVDGSFPDPTKTKYRHPIAFTNTLAVRAQAYSGEQLRAVGAEQYGFYFKQQPDGFDYLACTIDPRDLYSREQGILFQPNVRGGASERPCHVTWVRKNGEQHSCRAQIRLQGRSTRNLPVKKNFRLELEGTFPGTFFHESVTSTDAIVLKGHRFGKTHVNHACFRAAGLDSPYTRPVWLFVNGVPFGAYAALEKVHSESVLERLFGTLDLDVYKEQTWHAWKRGTPEVFDQQWGSIADLSLADLDFVDLSYFAQWMAMCSFLSAADGDQGYYVRRRAPGETWRFVAWDLDLYLWPHRPLRDSLGRDRGNLWDRLLEGPDLDREFDVQMKSIISLPYFRDGEPRRFYQQFEEDFKKDMAFEFTGLKAQHDKAANLSQEAFLAHFDASIEYHKNYYENRIAMYRKLFRDKEGHQKERSALQAPAQPVPPRP